MNTLTNLLSELSLSFVLITNWTGHVVGDMELGYVATNHNLSWTYETNNYVKTMKTVPSEIAAWRTNQTRLFIVTNSVSPQWIIPGYTYPRNL